MLKNIIKEKISKRNILNKDNEDRKKKKNNVKGIILNEPIIYKDNDWIGVDTYVDKLEEAIDCNAKMIAITSDFGSGKSSIVSLYTDRIEKKKMKNIKVYSVNLWSNLINEKPKDTLNLHKTFLYNIIKNISASKGSYFSKRLSKNYGLFKIQSNSTIHNFLTWMAFVLIVIEEIFRRFIEQKDDTFFNANSNNIQFLTGVVGIALLVYVVTKAEFIFSTTKSEGQREIDENVLINYYNETIQKCDKKKHFVFVIEDLDRTENPKTVLAFLKEIQKYYISTDKENKKNKVTFVVNIKPEAMLQDKEPKDKLQDKENENLERLYAKFFDYTIDLKKINIDNYDAILKGLLSELSEKLSELEIINFNEFDWIIRGKKIDIRIIKDRLNNSLTLYESLKKKFGKIIKLEKCTIATYLCCEYAEDYYKLEDRDFQSLIEKHISGKLNKNTNEWEGTWKNVTPGFRKEIQQLINNKLIDSSYRTYFYNYPKDSHLYDISQTMVYNAITYNETIKNKVDFEAHLKNVTEEFITKAMEKVILLGLQLPDVVLEYKKIFKCAVEKFENECIELFRVLPYEVEEIERTVDIIRKLFNNADEKVLTESFSKNLSIEWDNSLSSSSIVKLRKMLSETTPNYIVWFEDLFMGSNNFITIEEIDNLSNINIVLQLINYDVLPSDIEVYSYIHNIIVRNKKYDKEAEKFYLEGCKKYNIKKLFPLICEFCDIQSKIEEPIIKILVREIKVNHLKKEDYIEFVSSLENITNEVIESICEIEWYNGLSSKICNMLLQNKKYLSFICNMINAGNKGIDYKNKLIITTIHAYADFIYNLPGSVFLDLRMGIVKYKDSILEYMGLFTEKFPVIQKKEIFEIDDINIVLKILEETTIKDDEISYIADYFNSKYRNSTETFDILNYVCEIETIELSKKIFYLLDMENVRYRSMSKSRKNIIKTKMEAIIDFSLPSDIIEFLNHTKSTNDELELELEGKIPEDFKEDYINFANSVLKPSNQTIKNIVTLKTLYACNEKITNKMFEKKYYINYIVSKTLYDNKFVVEEEIKDVLWNSYIKILIGGNYNITIKHMKNNIGFINEVIEKEEYKNIGEKMLVFSYVNQNIGLLEEVFGIENTEFVEEYLSSISGFNSKESAEFFVESIKENSLLLKSENIYNNTYEKLIDGNFKSKYTRARNREMR